MLELAIAADALEIEQKRSINSEFEKGRDAFNAIHSYLSENQIGYTKESKKCISVSNIEGQKIYIRFYFNEVGGWGQRPLYTVGVYKQRKGTQAIVASDNKVLLMTSQRGINGFEDRFTSYLGDFSGRKLRPIKLTHSS